MSADKLHRSGYGQQVQLLVQVLPVVFEESCFAEILDEIATLDGEAAEVLGSIRKAVGKFKR